MTFVGSVRALSLTLCLFLAAIVANAVIAVPVDAQQAQAADTPAIRATDLAAARADSLYIAARQAQVAKDYPNAIRLFDLIVRRYPRSQHATAALYYKAFLLYSQYKQGQPTVPLRLALNTLQLLEKNYPNAPQASLGQSLQLRICGELGQLGDSVCVERIEKQLRNSSITISVSRPDSGKKPVHTDSAPRVANGHGHRIQLKADTSSDSLIITLRPDSTACSQVDKGGEAFIAALNGLWKVDTTQAIAVATNVLLQYNDACLSKIREQTLLTVLQRPTPVLSMTGIMFRVAKEDPEPNIKRLSLIWLRAQEWEPPMAKLLVTTFGEPFRTKAPDRTNTASKIKIADSAKKP